MTLGEQTQYFEHQICGDQRGPAGRIQWRRYFHDIGSDNRDSAKLAQKNLRLPYRNTPGFEPSNTRCNTWIKCINIKSQVAVAPGNDAPCFFCGIDCA